MMRNIITIVVLFLSVAVFGQPLKLDKLTIVEKGSTLSESKTVAIDGRLDIVDGQILIQFKWDYPVDVLNIITEPVVEHREFNGEMIQTAYFDAFEPSTGKYFQVAFLGGRDIAIKDEEGTVIWLTYKEEIQGKYIY